ncbi:hypothetical protein KIN20_005741 [Parelaphostrongylus tenuis]|uniref:Uncharacterized protein n=1 Tax=Parelaphostrongylus tenuis TaxID=148309 RepID=A0AAD5QIV3_PARTN|nr:hypothetical protein KIN20_005741 [Parelaphostrongylus tenuis]
MFPGIAATSGAASSFVSRLVMQAVIDVLEQQGRGAGLPDVVVSNILSQLDVQINYAPLECKFVTVGIPMNMKFPSGDNMAPNCLIVDNTVTIICTATMKEKCELSKTDNLQAVATKYTTIAGRLMTTNIIMANWSRQIGQSVVNRAVRMLASGPFRSHFVSAVVTVS